MIVCLVLFAFIWFSIKLMGVKVGYWYGLLLGSIFIVYMMFNYDGTDTTQNDNAKIESEIVLTATNSGFVEK